MSPQQQEQQEQDK